MLKFVPESEDEIRLRKCRGSLMICGYGMFLFGAWSVIKETMIYFAGRESGWYLANAVRESGMGKAAFLVVLYTLLFLDFLLRGLLGSMAIKVGRGKKQSKRYIVFVVLSAAVTLLIMTGMVINRELVVSFFKDPLDTAIIFAVDITASINTFELAFCSAEIRRLERNGVE